MPAPGPRKPRDQDSRNALGEFLRARRQLVTPEEAGIRVSGRRRSPGLRREELATLAGVSSPYYIRLEQGRDRHPSAQVVDALGRALRLDDQTFAYFKRLAGQVPDGIRPHSSDESVRTSVEQLVHGLHDVAALVIGRYRDVLAANRLAQALHVGYTPGQNLLRFLFLDPRARERVIDWDEVARQAVATLRADSSANVDDAHLRRLTNDLSGRSAQFRELWIRHDATSFNTGRIRFNNPVVGPITLNFESFPVAGAAGQSLGIAFPNPGGPGRTKAEGAQAARRPDVTQVAPGIMWNAPGVDPGMAMRTTTMSPDRPSGAGDGWAPAEIVAARIPVGGRVHDVITQAEGEHVYVALSHSVTVVDGRHHIVGTIPVGAEPKRLAVDADGRRLFVVHHGGSVSVIDIRDYTVRTLCGGADLDVVVSADGGRLYAAHGGVVSMVDVAGAATTATLPVVGDVAALALSPDGTHLYAVSFDRRTYYQYPAGWLTIIDITRHAVVDIIAVGHSPETITVSPDGGYAYITHHDTCSVSAVNLTTGTVGAVALGDAPLAVTFTPDGTHAYVTNSGSLMVIDTATHDVADIVTGHLPRGLRISPDGKRAYVTNFGDHTVSVVDTITNSVTATIDVPGYPEAVAISPDGERVYVGDYWSGAVTVISIPTVRDLHTDALS